jgi:hypothetical protein
VALGLGAPRLAAAAPYDWLQINGSPQHTGNNTQETILGATNVAGLTFFFQASLPGVADGAPVFLSAVNTSTGVRNLLFVTTKQGHIVALDARSGLQIWSHQYPAGSCRINLGSVPCYTTSSPAIDPNRLYVYSYGLDGSVHKYQVGDGTEITSGGWPELATRKPFNEKGSSALSIATAAIGTSYLYVTNGGYPGDAGDYQGHVTAINLSDGSQNLFNALCSDQAVHLVQTPGTPDCAQVQSAIWARVGVVYDNVTDRIYVGTGNGLYDGNSGGRDWGDSILALHPDATGGAGNPLDSYTPATFQQLQNSDADLGSTAPVILSAPGFSGRLAAQGGKDSLLRLINLENLSGQGGPGHTGGELQILGVPQGCEVLSALAAWTNPGDGSNWVFVVNDCGASGLRLAVNAGVPSLSSQWQISQGGFSPLIANNVLYYASGGLIQALDPVTGAPLWSDTTHIGGIHWETPVVVNGVLYITDESGHLTAYSLKPSVSTVSPPAGPTSGGTSVTISGSNLAGATSVTFGGAPAVITSNTASQLVVTTPAHLAGPVDVAVTTFGGSVTASSAYTYNPPAARVFLSASGADGNDCSVAATPCRTLAGALVQAADAGEVLVSGSGSYGGATITRSVFVQAPSGVVAFTGQPITVAAGAGDIVVLRGWTSAAATRGSGTGILFQSGAVLAVEECLIDGWATGIQAAGAGRLFVSDAAVRGSAAEGVHLASASARATMARVRLEGNATGLSVSAGASASVRGSCVSSNSASGLTCDAGDLEVDGCLAVGNGNAIVAGPGNATVRVSGSVLTDNATGLLQTGAGVLLSRGDNTVEGNAANTSGTIGSILGR